MSRIDPLETSGSRHQAAVTYYELIRSSLLADSLKQKPPHKLVSTVLDAVRRRVSFENTLSDQFFT